MHVINSRYDPAVPTGSLRRHDRNPREGDTGAIHQSIEHNGFYGACVVQESTGYILAGNHRFEAALHHGAASVPVIFVDCDDATALRILLVDNRANDLADYNLNSLAELLQSIVNDSGTLAGTGHDDESLRNVIRDLEGYTLPATVASADAASSSGGVGPTEVSNDPDKRPAGKSDTPTPADETIDAAADKREELLAKYGVKLGQIWRVGQHRIMCGDSTKAENVDALLAGVSPSWVWTDPPYGVSYVGKTAHAMEIKNDGAEGLDALLAGVFAQLARVMLPGAPIYIAHPHGPKSLSFAQAFVAAGFHWHQTLVWVKNSIVLGHSDYHYRHEPILYGWKENPAKGQWSGSMYPHRPWHGDRNKSTVLEFPKPSRSDLHPTTKPTGLISHCILNSSTVGAVGFEPFSGSGATILAAEEAGRVCYAMELDPRYVAVALERASLVGLATELLESPPG